MFRFLYITIQFILQSRYLQLYTKNMNMMSNMDEIADLIIRPNRYLYKPIDLGPTTFSTSAKNTTVHHHDFQLKNNRNLTIKGSLYSPTSNFREIKDIIVYLHCNSGCRIEGLAYLNMAIQNGFSYLVFDFAGSGVSEGKYISLGYYESQDIHTVIKFIRKKIGKNVKIGLWGRSMGAVAALIYLANQQNKKNIKGAIFDSPFYSLKDLFIAIGREKTSFPTLVLEVAIKYLKPIILRKAKFDMDNVTLKDIDKISDCPGVFIASKNDQLIPFSQLDMIFKQYGAHKEMLFVDESHNEPRNKAVINEAFITLKKNFEESTQIEQMYTETKVQKSPKQEGCYRSQLPSKEVSRKKLQLTIKSYSQKTLFLQKRKQSEKETPKKINKQISFPYLEKPERRKISCLFEKKKNKRDKFHTNKEELVQYNSKNSIEEFSEDAISLNHSLNLKQHFKNPKKPHIGIGRFFKEEINSQNTMEVKQEDNTSVGQNKMKKSPEYHHHNIEKFVSPKNIETQIRDRNMSLRTLRQNVNPKNQITLNRNQQQCSQKILLNKKDILRIKIPDGSMHSRQNSYTNCERKTMQHIANKKPPVVDNHKLVKLRNSFENKYRSEVSLKR